MPRRIRRFAVESCLVFTAALTAFPLIGHLSAQQPGQTAQPFGQLTIPADEVAPRLLVDQDGHVLRLWQRWTDFRTGGGGVLLAVASPGDIWHRLLEILPKEPGVVALDADVAIGSSKQVAVAYQWRRNDPRAKQIRLAHSNDGGKSWVQPATSMEGSGKGFTPKLAWGRGRILVVVWADERRAERAWDIYARRSLDGGDTWESEQLLSRFPQQTTADLSARPEMISDGQDRFWAVWVGLRNGRSSLYLSRSSDGGRSWMDPVALSGESVSVFGQRVVRAGERLLLVWQDTRTGQDRVYGVTSGDGGVTWTTPVRVDHVPADSQTAATSPTVVMSPEGEAFVAWNDGRNGRDDVFVGRSADGGRTWGADDVRIDADEAGTSVSRFPRIARADDGRLAVVWEDDRAGYEGIYLRVRSAGSSPAGGPEMIVAPPGPKKGARNPSVLWGRGGALFVAWEVWDISQGPMAVAKQIDSRVLLPDKK
jgi:hypothetical protein